MDMLELIPVAAAFVLGYWLVSMLLRLFSRSGPAATEADDDDASRPGTGDS